MAAGALSGAEPVQLKDQKQKVSYIIGHNIGGSIARDDLDTDIGSLISGINGGLAKQPSKISPQETQVVMQAFQQHMAAKQAAKGAPGAKPNATPAPPQSKEQIKKVSQIIGHNIGSSISRDGIEADSNSLIAGLKAGLAKQDSKISEEETKTIMQAFQTEMMAKQAAKSKEAAKVGQAFLEENKKKKGITVTKSGLQYQVIKSGSGKTPNTSDKVTTHYTGTLIDGTKFDSSVDRGQPATFGVTQVIGGWTEALQWMKEGDKWRLFIPYNLAYGERGSPPKIPPFAALIFKIELIKVN